ncbi:sensor histidine kinase [Paenibacillus tarimensis]|uniref:sensor histidine kinase n=1 Tax=Paenibacillus tarimensis TaxID=416012 RepID=UPI001F37D079|nr:ATP-binding protein [Paenibacillus tarimensis]MCF2945220.1 ATP-binding protein [Paenibacillus tarimensis]
MKTSGIRKHLFRSHIAVALVSLVIITILVHAAVYVSFGGYVRSQQQAELEVMVEELSAAYITGEGWSHSVLMTVAHRAMLRNMTVRITDTDGRIVWDTSTMGGHMPMRDMPVSGEQSSPLGRTEQAAILKDGVRIGAVQVGETGGIFHEQERAFLVRINSWIWMAFAVVMLGVYVYSKIISSRISRPLLRMKETANQMTAGDLKSRVQLDEGQSEIRELGDALNDLADKLHIQEQLRKNMTADVAHELRTPVATIRSHIEAFQDGIWEPSAEKLEVCHQQAMQLAVLIQDLEQLSEAENPMLKLQREELNLIPVIQEAQRAVQNLADGQDITYAPPEQGVVHMTGDRRRLLQIFINLIGNAYKYTPSGGRVAVRVSSGAAYVEVQIEDTGHGIQASELPYIFERFYRGEKSRNRKLGGAGIGLAVVKALVEAHEGTIEAASEISSGTIVTVRLPIPVT